MDQIYNFNRVRRSVMSALHLLSRDGSVVSDDVHPPNLPYALCLVWGNLAASMTLASGLLERRRQYLDNNTSRSKTSIRTFVA